MKTETKSKPNGSHNSSGNGTEMKELRLKVPAELANYLDAHCSDKRAWVAGAIVQRFERDKAED